MSEVHIIDLRGKAHEETLEILKKTAPELLQAIKAAAPEIRHALDGIAQTKKRRFPHTEQEKYFALAQATVHNAGIDLEDFYDVTSNFSKDNDTFKIGVTLMALGACFAFAATDGLSSLKAFKIPNGVAVRSKTEELMRIEAEFKED